MAAQRQPAADPRPRIESELIVKIIDELTSLYPDIERHVGERSNAGAGGSSASAAVPLNIEAYVFLNGRYWVPPINEATETAYPADEHTATSPCIVWSAWSRAQDRLMERTGIGAPVPRCGRCSACVEAEAVRACENPGCGARRDNWQRGMKLTVFWLEAETRRSLGFGLVSRARAGDGIYPDEGPDLRVLDALAYIRTAAQTLAQEQLQVARMVRDELSRINTRASGMVAGQTVHVVVAGRDPLCEYCGLETVHSDRDRAVCWNRECKKEDGSRRCWRRDPDTEDWVEVDEPGDRRGRGRNLTDDELATRTWNRPDGE